MKKSGIVFMALSMVLVATVGVGLGVSGDLSPFNIVPTNCEIQDSNCSASVSAAATATIAWWTRLDTILSLFTGVAAYFAYRAYKAAEREAQVSLELLELEKQRTASEKEQFADRERGKITLRKFSVKIAEGKRGEENVAALSLLLTVMNTGKSKALDVCAAGLLHAKNEGPDETINVLARTAAWTIPVDLDPSNEITLALNYELTLPLDRIQKFYPNISVEFNVNVEWFDNELNRLNFFVWESDTVPAEIGEHNIPIYSGDVEFMGREDVRQSVSLPIQKAKLPSILNPMSSKINGPR